MKLQIPDLSGYREKVKIGPGYKLGKGFSRTPKGRLFRLFKPVWLCAALLALLLSFFICKTTEGFLLNTTFETQRELATKINSDRKVSLLIMQSQKKQGSEVSFTLFNVAERSGKLGDDKQQKEIDAFTLVGTLPRIGAWLNDGNTTSLILTEQDYNGYKLELVDTGRVLLAKEGENFPLYLQLGGKTKPQTQTTTITETTQRQSNAGDRGIIPATEGNPGSIKKEILDGLLMNPYEELAKNKFRPSGSGMELERTENTSLLSQLGMLGGDVLTGINGVPIKDMAGVGNAVSSMLTSNQFNLELIRNSKPMQLSYTVK